MQVKTLAAVLCLGAAPLAAQPALPPNAGPRTGQAGTAGGGGVVGQQNNQASPSQYQSQQQTNQSQQPPQVTTLPPDAAAQNQPNPLPAAGSK